ncbi:MAG: molybdenum cofactor biosynthesis protein MoaE, partial [Prosthecobacter sp.]
YSAYYPMAEKMLFELVVRGQASHGTHDVFIHHRLGFVAAEQPSILIRVRTRHSAEAFELCRWYLKEVKTCVPIWKRPIFMPESVA